MNQKEERLGTDLAFFEYFKGQDKEIERVAWQTKSTLNNNYYPLGSDLNIKTDDFEIIQGSNNLEQAILHRLRTIKGELFDTGHPDYGCDMYRLIGEPNNEMTRAKLRLMIKDALLQERRIEEIVSIEVYPRLPGSQKENTAKNAGKSSNGSRSSPNPIRDSEDMSTVDITIHVKPSLFLSFPFSLEEVK